MDRALASGAKGRGFESLLARHFLTGSGPETWVTERTGYMGNGMPHPRFLEDGAFDFASFLFPLKVSPCITRRRCLSLARTRP